MKTYQLPPGFEGAFGMPVRVLPAAVEVKVPSVPVVGVAV
jgi:hypothetical protein